MKFYLTHTPWWLKKIYPTCIWDIPVAGKTVFLTFDDGPHETATQFVLQQLEQYKAKATFFCIGKNVAQYPEIFKQVKAEGHTVANHTMHHANGWKTNDDAYLKEIADADAWIGSSLFRPPYGRIKQSQIRKLQKSYIRNHTSKIIMWSVLSGDFDTEIDGERCFQNVIRKIKPGSIIVFHDSQKALPRLQYALPKLLQWMQENGYMSEAIEVGV